MFTHIWNVQKIFVEKCLFLFGKINLDLYILFDKIENRRHSRNLDQPLVVRKNRDGYG